MPIDPNIVLAGQPVQTQNPIDQYARLQQLRALGQQQQMGQIQLQQQQLQLQDQQKMRQAFSQWDGKNPDDLMKSVRQAGVSPQTMLSIQNGLLETKQKYASLDKATRDNLLAKNTQIQSALQPVLSEQDPAKQSQLWDSASKQLQTEGVITPQEAAQHPYPGDPVSAKAYITGLNFEKATLSQQQQATAAQRGAQAQIATAELPAKQVQSQQATLGQAVQQLAAAPPKDKNEFYARVSQLDPQTAQAIFTAVSPGAYDPAVSPNKLRQLGMNPEQQTTAALTDKQRQEQARHNAIEEKQAAQRIAIEQANSATERGRLAVEQKKFGFEAGGGVSPQAQAIAAGQVDPQTVRMMVRGNAGLISQVKAVDPNFDMANLDKRYETLKEFTNTSSAKAGGQVVALNTLIHHADLFSQVADALKNGTFQPGNAIYNTVATTFGDPHTTNAKLVAQFLAGETAKVAHGGVPNEADVNRILSTLNANASPDQLKQAGSTLLQIASGRMVPLQERVKDANLGNVVQVLGPGAKEALQRNGYDPNTMKPVSKGATSGPGFQVGQSVRLKSGKTVKVTAVHPDGSFDAQ